MAKKGNAVAKKVTEKRSQELLLLKAAEEGDGAGVTRLTRQGVDVNCTDQVKRLAQRLGVL
jgi:hypothetical protein